jgi:predicted TIM-barrel fold metal-dependent hydrolase
MFKFEIPDYGIIDAHMHPYLASHRDFPFAVPATYAEYFAEQNRFGVTLNCGSFNIFNDGSNFEVIKECNNNALAAYKEFPNQFLPGVNVHPNFPEESCSEVEKFFQMGFRWIGELAWYVMNYKSYYQDGLLPVFDLAQNLDMVVSLHPTNLEDLENILKNFPRLKVVWAHPGDGNILNNYAMAKKYKNLYIDLSGTGLFRWGMLKKGVDLIGADHILFGSDFPVCSTAMNVAGVLSEKLSNKERKLIFRDNFLNITGYQIK